MSHRVLIVSPHFPPVNAPDCQRVRMSLPYLREFGWEAHILTVSPEHVEGFKDVALTQTVPTDVPVTRVGAIPARLSRRLGFGSLSMRAGRSLRIAGKQILKDQRFDLVYFSTTIFQTMTLGPLWRQKFRIPYVIDIQDPWVSDYYSRTGTSPPGGRLRYALAQRLARRDEPTVVRGAGHVLAVSPAYPEQLRSRYPDLPMDRFSVLPFAAAESDFAAVEKLGVQQTIFNPTDGRRHWVSLGRGGPDLACALRGLFQALATLRQTDPRVNDLRLHFVGTSYAPTGRAIPSVAPIAAECGVSDLVDEITSRVPYLDGLALLQDADNILIIGSDDASYSASKVYPCVLSKRPLLAILHKSSAAGDFLRKCRAGIVVNFPSGIKTTDLAVAVRSAILHILDQPRGSVPNTDWEAFAPYSAREMTRRQCEVFDRVVGGSV